MLCQSPALAVERVLTVSLDHLWGFERYIDSAASEVKLPLVLLRPGGDGDYRIHRPVRFFSLHALMLYRKSTGRSENAVLELYDSRSKKVIVSHLFTRERREDTQRQAAREFLTKVQRHAEFRRPALDSQPTAR